MSMCTYGVLGFLSAHTSADQKDYEDEEPCEDRADLEFEDDTDKEYMRRPS